MNLNNTGTLTPDAAIALMQTSQINSKLPAGTLKKIDDSAKEFEAIFISEMMKPMFEGISTEAPFGGGKGEEMFRGMMLQEYGRAMADTGRVGIAKQVKDELIRMQESANSVTVEKKESGIQ